MVRQSSKGRRDVHVEQPLKVTNQPGSWNASQVAVNTLLTETESWSNVVSTLIAETETQSWSHT